MKKTIKKAIILVMGIGIILSFNLNSQPAQNVMISTCPTGQTPRMVYGVFETLAGCVFRPFSGSGPNCSRGICDWSVHNGNCFAGNLNATITFNELFVTRPAIIAIGELTEKTAADSVQALSIEPGNQGPFNAFDIHIPSKAASAETPITTLVHFHAIGCEHPHLS